MKSKIFFNKALLAFSLLLFRLPAYADQLEQDLKSAFLKSKFAETVKDSIDSSDILYKNVFNKYSFNLYSEANRNSAEKLNSPQLQRVGRYEQTLDTMTIGGKYRFINSPQLSSLTLDSNYTIQKSDYQLLNSTFETESNNARSVSFTVSYDVVKGGQNEPRYLASSAEMNDLKANLYRTYKTQRDNYLSFLGAAFGVLVSNCKLQNLETSLKEIENSEKIFQLGSKIGTYPYKDFLNVKSLKKVIESIYLSLKIELLNRRQNFTIYGNLAKSSLEKVLSSNNYCDRYLGLEAKANNGLGAIQSSQSDFNRTLDSHAANSQIDSSKNKIKSAQINLKPSVQPFLTYSRSKEQVLDIEDKRITLGVKFDWDVASAYGKATASSEVFNLKRLGTQYNLLKKQFENDVTNLKNKNEVIDLQIANVRSIIDINDELLRILSTQRSIGKIDSLSLTNAYINRNQSLNQLYELNAEMILNNYRYHYLFDWEAFMDSSESSVKQ